MRPGFLLPALVAAALALGGCSGLQPLPAPGLAPCGTEAATPAGLWRCIDDTAEETGTDLRAAPRESAFRSTSRIVQGDLGRKRADQRVESACGGPVPPGFQTVDAPAATAGRAPLRAYFRPPREPGLPTVIVVHGLYDSKHSRYVRLSAEALAASGFGVLAPDMRWHGCLLADYLPTLGREEGRDLVAWRGWLRTLHPESAVGLLGYSLGALAVINALAEEGEAFGAGGITVSPPAAMDLSLTALDDPPSFTDRGLQALVRRFFQQALRQRMRTLGVAEGPDRRPFAACLAWLVRQPGFPAGTTPAEFIAGIGPTPQLAAIRRPLLLVISRRDPIFHGAALAELAAAAAANPHLHLIVTTDGGHIGHLGTYPRWTAEVFHRFFAGGAESAGSRDDAGL